MIMKRAVGTWLYFMDETMEIIRDTVLSGQKNRKIWHMSRTEVIKTVIFSFFSARISVNFPCYFYNN